MEKNIHIIVDDTYQCTFREIVQYLFSHTFILRQKKPDYIEYLKDSRHFLDINDYLSLIGYQIRLDQTRGIAMLDYLEMDDDDGIKDPCLEKLSKAESHLQIVLWKIYLDRINEGHIEPTTTTHELINTIQAYGLKVAEKDTWLKNALKKLKRYNLIDYKGDPFESEDKIISLYDSLSYCLNLDAFKEVASEYIGTLEDNMKDETVKEPVENTDEALQEEFMDTKQEDKGESA